jgi:hypothetical protein
MIEEDDFDRLEESSEALNGTLAATSALVAGFDGELRRMRLSLAGAGKDVRTLERGLGRGLRRAFDGVVFDGKTLSDALRTVSRSLADTAYAAAIRPVTSHVSGLVAQGVGSLVEGILPFEKGAAFSQGKVMPFAQGGVVSGPVAFPMRGGTGLMGEAGPEAILPLARRADGSLGVRGGSGGVSVVMNISTPDVEGFRRSRSQIAAQMSRALSAGARNG